MPNIQVSLQEYEKRPVQMMSGIYHKSVMAFWMRFPDGTCSWANTRASVRALAKEYNRSVGKFYPISWDASCGTFDP